MNLRMELVDDDSGKQWYDWGDENQSFPVHHFDFWSNRLKMNPIDGIEINSREDLIGLYAMLDAPNPFNDADPYGIFY